MGCSQCGREPVEARGLCQRHYMQWWLGKDIPAPLTRNPRGAITACTVEGCGQPHQAKGLCVTHYHQARRPPKPAALPPRAKLTPEAVREIRDLHASGESLAALGRKFGVRDTAVSKIVKRQTWAHID